MVFSLASKSVQIRPMSTERLIFCQTLDGHGVGPEVMSRSECANTHTRRVWFFTMVTALESRLYPPS